VNQPSLLYIPGATEGTTQWRAHLLQLVNWGGFHGYAQMPFAHDATLLSGASGTGKSTLLDAYIAVMMPSDIPFNGASNDTATGRARGADQRNLLSYLRGKRDTNREPGTEELADQVLRGHDSATWGALAMTFIDDLSRRFTVMRAYFVPQGAIRTSDLTIKMATLEGNLDLRDLEPLAASRFDKRTMTARWPELKVHDSYATFSQTLFTRLGIGAGGDGAKALRLLARIQGNQQIRTVDGLYKTMVLEQPGTYTAADLAAEHFAALDDSYTAMLTEAQKLKVLEPLPDHYRELDEAQSKALMIDTFGLSRDGDSPFLLWQTRTEARLLAVAVDHNRDQRDESKKAVQAAKEHESSIKRELEDVATKQRANGGELLERIRLRIEELQAARTAAENRLAKFLENTSVLRAAPRSDREFAKLQANASQFLAGFADAEKALGERIKQHAGQSYPLLEQRKELGLDLESLRQRKGLVPRPLHEARVQIAAACGLTADDLPFVAELIDLASGEEEWRHAAEATLFAVARVILVDRERLEFLSRMIDPLKIHSRVRFEGVALEPFSESLGRPGHISGKLVHKDSPFSAWVQDRVRRAGTDALCVDDPRQLAGEGLRVTRGGQTRHGSSGSHGELRDKPAIGFSNTERILQLEEELSGIQGKLDRLDEEERLVRLESEGLGRQRDAHRQVLDTEWTSIDVQGIAGQIRDQQDQRDRILVGNDILAQLQKQHERLDEELDKAQRNRYGAERRSEQLDQEHSDLAMRQDETDRQLDRLEETQAVGLSGNHAAYLDELFPKVGNASSLPDFKPNITRLRRRLADEGASAQKAIQDAVTSLQRIFEEYQRLWPDPNLGTAIDSYDGYRDILDEIVSTGLHERRDEWRRRLSKWSGEDLVPLNGAFDTAVEDIEERLIPVNAILGDLPFGPNNDDRLRISLRRLHLDDITRFRKELKELSSGVTQEVPDREIEQRFVRLRKFIDLIRAPEAGAKPTGSSRDFYLDVRKHVEVTAVRENRDGVAVATYASLRDKSGGEAQELIAFIVGAALRFQLGDEDRARPRFAPVFLDEGFIKADSQYAGRAVNAWLGLGFQLMIGAPFDKVSALEPYMQLILAVTKTEQGYSYVRELRPAEPA
jgi:uncharacterized protein YPO0396